MIVPSELIAGSAPLGSACSCSPVSRQSLPHRQAERNSGEDTQEGQLAAELVDWAFCMKALLHGRGRRIKRLLYCSYHNRKELCSECFSLSTCKLADHTQASVYSAEPGVSLGDPDATALDVLGGMLSSFGGALFDQVNTVNSTMILKHLQESCTCFLNQLQFQ